MARNKFSRYVQPQPCGVCKRLTTYSQLLPQGSGKICPGHEKQEKSVIDARPEGRESTGRLRPKGRVSIWRGEKERGNHERKA